MKFSTDDKRAERLNIFHSWNQCTD